MTRWIFYGIASALLLAFVLGMKYLANIEGGSFGDGFVAGGAVITCVMLLGLWLQERSYERQSERDER